MAVYHSCQTASVLYIIASEVTITIYYLSSYQAHIFAICPVPMNEITNHNIGHQRSASFASLFKHHRRVFACHYDHSFIHLSSAYLCHLSGTHDQS